MLTPRADSANPPAFSLHRSCPLSSSSARRLSLHPSALSDAERALLTASLADLADTTGSETVDQILRLFAPATTLSSGAFFAALRLVLHAQAGRGVDRGLAFVQCSSRYYCYLTGLSASSARPRPPAAAAAQTHLAGVADTRRHVVLRVLPVHVCVQRFVCAAATDTPCTLLFPLTRRLPSPPTHPLRRASTQRVPASSPPHIQHFANRTASGGTPRRQGPIQIQTQGPKSLRPDLAPAARLTVRAHLLAPFARPFDAARHARGAYPTSAGPRTTSFAPHPPVHPQRRASAFEGGVRRALPSFEFEFAEFAGVMRVQQQMGGASRAPRLPHPRLTPHAVSRRICHRHRHSAPPANANAPSPPPPLPHPIPIAHSPTPPAPNSPAPQQANANTPRSQPRSRSRSPKPSVARSLARAESARSAGSEGRGRGGGGGGGGYPAIIPTDDLLDAIRNAFSRHGAASFPP
ncbi:hypothetical protein B0H17DRAFT_1218631 [Mycena rosella]|uniref:Uncharacterized protein n=1 Tax=Mycena rosella TaxID=1033263 RepID=A0AAD7BNV6_MYCRO|nr:hypothetical protein B0H17DRAFT_1218631 [Mycena rosella]